MNQFMYVFSAIWSTGLWPTKKKPRRYCAGAFFYKKWRL